MCHMVNFTSTSCSVSNCYFCIIYLKRTDCNHKQLIVMVARMQEIGMRFSAKTTTFIKTGIENATVESLATCERHRSFGWDHRPIYNKVPCYSKYGTLKIPQCSIDVRAMLMSFSSNVTSTCD